MAKKTISFTIDKKIAVLSEGANGWKKELNIVQWGENALKYDIRSWNEDYTKMGKGITLTKEELIKLLKVVI